MPTIDLSILNQRQTPAFYADVFANRPAAGFVGRIFVSTNTFAFYRDNGTGWDLIGGPGTGTITGSGASGQIALWDGASTITGDTGLTYNGTANSLTASQFIVTGGTSSQFLKANGSVDSNTYNTGSGAVNQVAFFSGTNSISGENELWWDNVNNRLGINTNTPGTALDVHNNTNTILQLNQTVATNDTRIAFQNSGTALWRIGNLYNAGANDFEIFDVVGALQSMTVKKTTGQVLIGTTSVGSGKLVVASTTGDNGIQIVGATAPSLRIDSAASGPTKRAGLGISTATNNFIQGSADRDFCIFNGSTTASPMLFGIYDAGLTNTQEAARISPARNFIIGSNVDAGYKLDVNGSGRFTGVVYADNTIRVGNGIIGTNSNNLYLSSNTTGGEISFWSGSLSNKLVTIAGNSTSNTIQKIEAATTFGAFHIINNASSTLFVGVNNSAGSLYGGIGGAYGGAISMDSAYALGFGTSGLERMRILASGDILFKGNSNAALSSAYFENINSRFAIYSTEGGGTTKDIVLQSGGSGGAPSVTLKAGGNFLVGTTTDNGSKFQVNGTSFASGFRTSYLSGIVIPNNTATTIFTITSEAGLYIIYVDLPNGAGSPANYSAYAIISYDAVSARILQQTDASNLFITLSGNNVQARQTSGNPNDVVYRFIKIV